MNNLKNSETLEETKYFYSLTPEVIDRSIKEKGLIPSGRVFALNSLENRVYEVEVDPHPLLDEMKVITPSTSLDSVIVKFYRPGRWSFEAIQEEHHFINELLNFEIPVIPPLSVDGETLFTCKETGFFYALFPKVRGRLKDELNKEEISQIGRLTARIHNIGGTAKFKHRLTLHPDNYMNIHFKLLENSPNLPQTTVGHYLNLCKELTRMITPYFEGSKDQNQRIHGDLHRGNILWTNDGPYVLDFDDTATGPKEQDLWPLFPGRDEYALNDRFLFLEAYHTIAKSSVSITPFAVEVLRTLRMVHFNGWIAKRYQDPYFKRTYPTFESQAYWEGELLGMKEQWGYLQDTHP